MLALTIYSRCVLVCVIICFMGEEKKILGIDFGERRIGLAIAEHGLAEPLAIIEVSGPPSLKLRRAVLQIVKICKQEEIQEIVLGLPLDSEGLVGPAAKKAKKFGQRLAKETGRKIIFWDETLTSEEALSKMIETGKGQKSRRRLDDISAAIILQEFLDSRRFKN